MPIANYTVTTRAYKALSPSSYPRSNSVGSSIREAILLFYALNWTSLKELYYRIAETTLSILNATCRIS